MLVLVGLVHLCPSKYLFKWMRRCNIKSICFKKKYNFVEWLLANAPYSAIHFHYDLSEWELHP